MILLMALKWSERLTSKGEALSPTPSTAKNKNKEVMILP
jgi:hypothetical protein